MTIPSISPKGNNDITEVSKIEGSFARNVKSEMQPFSKNILNCFPRELHIKYVSQKFRTVKQSFVNSLSVAKNQILATTNSIKKFFDEISTRNDICKCLKISKNEWGKLPTDLRIALVKTIISNNNDDETAINKHNLIEKFSEDLKNFIQSRCQKYGAWNTAIQKIQNLFEDVEALKIDLKEEKEQEVQLHKQLKLITSEKGPSRAEKALAISKTFGGETISKELELSLNGKKTNVKTEAIPQKRLSGFGEDKELKHIATEFQGNTPNGHATNLWQQKITVGKNSPISFIRFSNTRGNESATKEVLTNALTTIYDEKTILSATEEHPLQLNFSNIQLMTPGKIEGATDGEMPQKQMEAFNELSKKEQPLKFVYQGKEIFVHFPKPLLFNFGVNVQHFSSLFKPIVNHTKCDQQNDESFRKLFGNFRLFGGDLEEPRKGEDGHYVFDKSSLVGRRLVEPGLNSNTKEQILSLADQIIDTCHNNKNGILENPYALPSRVAMLTNLLSYATSYNCKSGKDRTGVMAMELENLTAKVLTDNKPYDFQGHISPEEQKNLQSFYKAGTSIEIAKINTGNAQKGLKIEQLGGLFTSVEERFGVDVSKDFYANRTQM